MRFGRRSRIGDAEFQAGRKLIGEPLVEVLQGELGEALVAGLAGEEGRVAERGEIKLAAKFKFLFGKALEIVVPGKLDRRRVRSEGLDHDQDQLL